MNKKHKKTCKYLNYLKNLFILASTITGCLPTTEFASLACVLVGITSSAEGIKFFDRTKKYKSVIKKKKRDDNKLDLLEEAKLNIIEVLISKSLINSYISHEKFVSIRYKEMKEEIKNREASVECTIKICLI